MIEIYILPPERRLCLLGFFDAHHRSCQIFRYLLNSLTDNVKSEEYPSRPGLMRSGRVLNVL